jgi:hypothetical protein
MGVVGYLIYRRTGNLNIAASIWGVTAAVAVAGLIQPASIRPVYLFLSRLTYPIGWVLSHVILFAAYYLVITPVGLIMRIFHDPMRRKFERETKSYWMTRDQDEMARYFRQV